MRLLSRNAEALFWLARYLERAASLSRVIEMQSSFGNLDRESGWTWLLALLNDELEFRERFEVSAANIIAFYTTDNTNPGSLRSSVHWARENARALRPFIPLEMWVQLNAFHTAVEAIGAGEILPAQLPRTCSQIRAGCLAQIGIAEATLFRDEGYQFFRLGLLIERADQTSRLLDVKFAQSSARTDLGSGASREDEEMQATATGSDEFVFWSTILRTAAAYQVFHRLEMRVATPERVARFLICNQSHPRSIAFCIREIDEALHVLRKTFRLQKTSKALEACDLLVSGVQALPGDASLIANLHAFNDWVQRALIALTADIAGAFFGPTLPHAVAAPDAALPVSDAQSTSGELPLHAQTQGQVPSQSPTQSQSQDQTLDSTQS